MTRLCDFCGCLSPTNPLRPALGRLSVPGLGTARFCARLCPSCHFKHWQHEGAVAERRSQGAKVGWEIRRRKAEKAGG